MYASVHVFVCVCVICESQEFMVVHESILSSFFIVCMENVPVFGWTETHAGTCLHSNVSEVGRCVDMCTGYT